MPYYMIQQTNAQGNPIDTRVVKARDKNQALIEIASRHFKTELLDMDQLVRLMTDGYKPIVAKTRATRGRPRKLRSVA
jgi:hypothetical protein